METEPIEPSIFVHKKLGRRFRVSPDPKGFRLESVDYVPPMTVFVEPDVLKKRYVSLAKWTERQLRPPPKPRKKREATSHKARWEIGYKDKVSGYVVESMENICKYGTYGKLRFRTDEFSRDPS